MSKHPSFYVAITHVLKDTLTHERKKSPAVLVKWAVKHMLLLTHRNSWSGSQISMKKTCGLR